MPIAEIGPWEFLVPDSWNLKENDSGVSYFEAPDGTQGMYIKSIELKAPKDSAHDLADYIQGIHQRSFEDPNASQWRIADRRGVLDGMLYRSALDMYDQASAYRVLSLVVSDAQQAIQVTVHDYLCEDYTAAKDSYVEIEESILRMAAAGAA
jgi:hypothetical protein